MGVQAPCVSANGDECGRRIAKHPQRIPSLVALTSGDNTDCVIRATADPVDDVQGSDS
jgi:hypothetical protein